MIDQSARSKDSGRDQRLLRISDILKGQIDLLDQDGWAIAAARLSSVIDVIDADLESLRSLDAGD